MVLGWRNWIREDCRVTTDNIAGRLEVSHGDAAKMVEELGFEKVFAKWVLKQLTKLVWSFLSVIHTWIFFTFNPEYPLSDCIAAFAASP